jgi:hypothetical protein
VRRLAANKAIGRAEALRRSMLALIDGKAIRQAQPSFWAPFVLVGEGGGHRVCRSREGQAASGLLDGSKCRES